MADTFTSLYEPMVVAAVAGSEAYSQLNTTSAEVKGTPSMPLHQPFSASR
jgi:hypothetical protein